jgi:hypothetical protein
MQLPESGMAITAWVILVCALVGGALTAYVRLAEKNTPFDIGLLHGRAGALATLLLLAAILTGNESSQTLKYAVGLLALTILGGTALYFLIRRKGILPRSIIVLHATFAVGAVYTLIFGLPF